MLASASVSDILRRTHFAHMGSTSPSSSPPPPPPLPPSPSTNGVVVVNGINRSSHVPPSSTSPSLPKPTILHLGDEICYNIDIYNRLASQFEIIRPEPIDLERRTFMRHLRDRKWGNFSAIMKPFWASGSQMHPWDQELIDLLPDSMRVMAGAGAGFDWVDTVALAARGTSFRFA